MVTNQQYGTVHLMRQQKQQQLLMIVCVYRKMMPQYSVCVSSIVTFILYCETALTTVHVYRK